MGDCEVEICHGERVNGKTAKLINRVARLTKTNRRKAKRSWGPLPPKEKRVMRQRMRAAIGAVAESVGMSAPHSVVAKP